MSDSAHGYVENIIPDFQNIRIVLVHKVRSIAATNEVIVNLTARPTRTLITHFPEVVLHVTREDMVVRHSH